MTAAPTPGPLPVERVPFALQDGEVLLRIVRRHWAHLAWTLTRYALAMLVPAGIFLAIWSLVGDLTLIPWVIALGWIAGWAVRIYFSWYQYRNDIWVVTNQRIVDSRKRHWFDHHMASADLVGVEDMKVSKSGVLATMFGFGDLKLQTASAQSNFTLSGVPDPASVLALVDAHRDAARRDLRGATG